MNKADKIFIGCIIMVVCILYIPSLWTSIMNQGKRKEVVVSFKDQEVLRVPLDDDADYQVEGTLGEIKVEVQDHKVRVEKETSPHHLCSIQGWVDSTSRPIVCLPNNIVVVIESYADERDVDVVIQ